jgi:hypothetical protein
MRVEQVVLHPAVPAPSALRRAAGREPAGAKPQRAAARKADDDPAARRDIAARRDEALAGELFERSIDRERLDHAVQVERNARRPGEQAP